MLEGPTRAASASYPRISSETAGKRWNREKKAVLPGFWRPKCRPKLVGTASFLQLRSYEQAFAVKRRAISAEHPSAKPIPGIRALA